MVVGHGRQERDLRRKAENSGNGEESREKVENVGQVKKEQGKVESNQRSM